MPNFLVKQVYLFDHGTCWILDTFFFFLLRRNISAGGLGVGKMEITVVEIRGSRESLKVECWDSDVLMEVVVDIRYLDKDKK